MKKIWHPWDRWECIGMYIDKVNIAADQAKKLYADFLRDLSAFEHALNRVINEWPISCEHFLTKDMNRIAWLGQASMYIERGVPRNYRSGFMLLNNEERAKANGMAEVYLNQWIEKHERQDRQIYSDLDDTWLFRTS